MALENSSIFNEFPALKPQALRAGVWGKQCETDHVLQDTDRVEIYRKLRVDPKVARRERFNKQGSKGAGLFATNRPGAKAGY
jgi:putative ubiquitin-RnfH superfamily antitoxin RatB of RatAB toxin-antitoxin module